MSLQLYPGSITFLYVIAVECPVQACRNKLFSELPSEMSTAWAILCYDDIHNNNQDSGEDEASDEDGNVSKKAKGARSPAHANAVEIKEKEAN